MRVTAETADLSMSTSDLQELPIFDIVKATLDDERLPHDDSILDRRIREVLAERMEHGATGELDLRLAAVTGKWKRSERAGWHS